MAAGTRATPPMTSAAMIHLSRTQYERLPNGSNLRRRRTPQEQITRPHRLRHRHTEGARRRVRVEASEHGDLDPQQP
jgi:hypothetical protein